MNYHQLKMFVINDGGLMSDIDYLAAKWVLLEKQRYIRPMGIAVNLAYYDIDAAITHAHEVYRTTYDRYEGRRAWYWWGKWHIVRRWWWVRSQLARALKR